ncbi:Alpha/Beta hydrolase protein [Mariannaea sp. PMI_226]|nr:Alpha/Beta hydrolase protein [Mariannaea sp. PMI_226]
MASNDKACREASDSRYSLDVKPRLSSDSDLSDDGFNDVSAPVLQKHQDSFRPRHSGNRNWKRRLLCVALPVVVMAATASVALAPLLFLHQCHDGNKNDNDNISTPVKRVVNVVDDSVTDLSDGPVVDLGYSQFQGRYLDNGVSQFLGMPYAAPPTGDLRWRAPVRPLHQKTIQSAQEWGSICLGVDQDLKDGSYEEDCLTVNVWAPTNASRSDKLPVMLFIQGGGYITDSKAHTNGSMLVETSELNMVFVSFNYRVGLFGFLASQDVQDDGVLNAGLLDQRFVMQWVQQHISKEIDPRHVVLQGVSAGAGSVGHHLAAYGGRDEGLFIAAIAESTFWPGQPHYLDVEYQYQRLLNDTGCTTASSSQDSYSSGTMTSLACLRNLNTSVLQSSNDNLPFQGQTEKPNFYWTPVTDGDFVTDSLSSSFQRGQFVNVPILYGSTTNEGTQFTPNVTSPDKMASFLQSNYPLLTKRDTNSIIHRYPLEPVLPLHGPWYASAAKAYGDATFVCPTSAILNAISSVSTSDIFSYRYNLSDTIQLDSGHGTPHTFETAAVFGPSMTMSSSSYTTYNAPIVPIVQNYWISFVRSLNPNTYRYEDAPEWLPWGKNQSRLVIQLPESEMEDIPQLERQRCDFWRDMNEVMAQ